MVEKKWQGPVEAVSSEDEPESIVFMPFIDTGVVEGCTRTSPAKGK
jgi:hypothetical protein